MSALTLRVTFALDEVTLGRLRRLASSWAVSESEVVQRAVELAEMEVDKVGTAPIDRLRAYHVAGGLDSGKARSWIAEVTEARSGLDTKA